MKLTQIRIVSTHSTNGSNWLFLPCVI